MTRTLLLCLVLAAGAEAQGPRIFIVTDMEGVGGVNSADEQLLPGQRRYEESRRLLTGEINAAVEGCFKAGASEVVVWDGHDGSRTLSIDEIDRRARLIQGKPTPPDYYLEAPNRYDGVMFVGQHPMSGAKGGVLAHSQSFSVLRISINGRSVGEIGQTAAIAGYFNIPVIMLSGDQAAGDEIRELQPKAEVVAVKRLAGKGSTVSISHAEAKTRIEAAAKLAVQRVREFKPWKIAGPVELKFEYADGAASAFASAEGRQATPWTVVYRGATVLEAFEQWMKR